MKNHNNTRPTGSAHHLNLQLQADRHPLVDDREFPSIESYVLHLIHLRAYDEATHLVKGKAVLDVGCNIGYGMQVMSSSALSVAGIDVSPESIKAAQRRLGPAADIRLYDGVRCSFAPHTFDAVTSFQVIEHVSDYDAYFSEIIRLLRPDGMVLFTTPNACLRLDPGMRPWNEFHVREFTPMEFKELLRGWFDVVEVFGLFGREELYRIERSRVERARLSARRQSISAHLNLRSAAKRVFPWLVPVRNALRTWTARDRRQPSLAISEMERYSSQDFFYRTDGLEDALDLMAICRLPRTR